MHNKRKFHAILNSTLYVLPSPSSGQSRRGCGLQIPNEFECFVQHGCFVFVLPGAPTAIGAWATCFSIPVLIAKVTSGNDALALPNHTVPPWLDS